MNKQKRRAFGRSESEKSINTAQLCCCEHYEQEAIEYTSIKKEQNN